jgi:uncharacterized protein
MTTNQTRLSFLTLALALLSVLAGCTTDEPTARKEPAKAPPASSAREVELLQVAAKGDTARVRELLALGINVNVRGTDRNTPIMEAAYAGHLDTVKVLLDHGADLSAKKNDGAMPASLVRSKEVADLFKNVVDLVDASFKGDLAKVKALIDKGTPVNGLDPTGRSALTEASWNGKTEVVKLLLEKGADPTIKKPDGQSPLNFATDQKHPEIVALLNEAIAKKSNQPVASPPAK